MQRTIAIAIPLLLLSACGEAGGSSKTLIEPGRWDITTEYLTMPEVERPVELEEAMGAQQNITQICVNEVVAQKPTATVFAPGASEIECTFNEVKFADGKINAHASCMLPGVTDPADMVFTGTYTRESYQTEWTLHRKLDGEELESKGTLSGQRSGAC